MSRPRIANKTPYLWIQRLKNPTLLGGTYLYSLYMGLKFGWVHFRKYVLLRSAFGAILVGDSSCRYCMWEKLLRRMYLSNIYKPTDRQKNITCSNVLAENLLSRKFFGIKCDFSEKCQLKIAVQNFLSDLFLVKMTENLANFMCLQCSKILRCEMKG